MLSMSSSGGGLFESVPWLEALRVKKGKLKLFHVGRLPHRVGRWCDDYFDLALLVRNLNSHRITSTFEK
jgi:hypothetical protein